MIKLASALRNPFSFLFARSTQEERVAAYVIREHERGRSLEEVLADPYVRNGLVTRWQVREWTTVVGPNAAAPVQLPTPR